MNRAEAREELKRLAWAKLERYNSLNLLESNILGGFTANFTPAPGQKVSQTPEINLYTDKDAFDNIVGQFLDEIFLEEDITDEWCDECIAAIQQHFAGVVIFGGDDGLTVYEPDPNE